MRRNLAVVIGNAPSADGWFQRAAAMHQSALANDGAILAIASDGANTHGLPTIADDGSIQARLGIDGRDTPSIFVLDRYGMVFATNTGATSTPELAPEDIPHWLEFIACRCS